MPNIVDIHVRRGQAGRVVPFDKIYLFGKEDEHLIPRFFTYALVMPLRKELLEGLFHLRPTEINYKYFRRNDLTKKNPVRVQGEPMNGQTPPEVAKAWWDAFIETHKLTDRLVVIPILTSIVRRKIRPRYLSAEKWHTDKNKKLSQRSKRVLNNAITDFAYLSTPKPPPDDKISPVCNVCPRMLLHLQGECTPGQVICYKSLDFATIGEDGEDAGLPSHNHHDP